MPDIAMCQVEDCPKRAQCYRYTACPSHYQSYIVGQPRLPDGSCDMFWPNTNEAAKTDAADPDSF